MINILRGLLWANILEMWIFKADKVFIHNITIDYSSVAVAV